MLLIPSGLKLNEILVLSEQEGAIQGMCKEVKLLWKHLSMGGRCKIFHTCYWACAEPKCMPPEIPFEHFILIREFKDSIIKIAEVSSVHFF